MIMTGCIREISDEAETVRLFYLASLDDSSENISKCIRDHWHVENSLHRVLDVTFRQDECRIGTVNAAASFAILKHAAMDLLRRAPGKMSRPQKRHSAARDDDCMEQIIRQ